MPDQSDHPPDTAMTLTIRSNGQVEVWTREAMHGTDLAEILRRIADGFAEGDVARVE